MIAAIIRWSLENRVLVLLVTVLFVVMGVRALKQTPIDAIPDLSDVQVIIKTSYPGQAPNVVEDQVTRPLSTALLSVPGAQTVRGFSFYGDSYVYVIFEDDTDMYWARSRVLEYLNQVAGDLPSTAKPQLGPDASGVGWVYIYALQDPSGKHDLAQLRSLQDWVLKYELQSLPGVAEIAPVGGMVKQYQVVIDPQKLMYHDVPLSHVRTAIEQSNQESGVSVLELAEAEYMLRATGYIEGVDDLKNIPLGLRHNDVPLFIHHIADVVQVPTMRRGVAELNGVGETVGGIVIMRHGENAQKVIDSVKNKIAELKKTLPKGVEITPVYDRSKLITSAVKNLWIKVLQELLLVGALLVVFLFSVRSALVAIITLPIGILISFVIMRMHGVNANIMSLGGIAIAIGAMVDGAIVMIENLHRKMREQKTQSHWQNVCDSALEVGPTLFFSLLIITISFLPVFTLEAEEGRLFAPLAYTKTYAMGAAAILSITLMPVLLYFFVRSPFKSNSSQSSFANQFQSKLQSHYQDLLQHCLNHRIKTIIAAFVICALSIIPLQNLSSEFMPPLDEGDLMYMPTTHPGISIGKARELLQQTDRLIKTVPEVNNVFGKVGRAETATDPAPLTMIETFIELKPRNRWRPGLTTQDIINELDEKVKIPGVSNAWVMPIKTRIDMLATGMKTPLGIKLAGPDSGTLQTLGQDIEALLGELPHTQSVYAERSAGGRYMNIEIDRQAAARYNLKIAEVHHWLQMSVAGTQISEAVEGVERYPISVRFPDDYRDTPERLLDLPIVVKDGVHLRLGDIAQLEVVTGPPMFKSENARINTWIFLDIGDYSVSDYVQQAEAIIDENIQWPSSYTMRWAGQYESIKRVKESLLFIIPLTLVIIAILLYLNFRRFSDVCLLFISLPFALVGGLLLVAWLDFKISVAVIVGFIALAGLAVETGAIMLQVLRGSTSSSDDSHFAQIKQYASYRVRPVLMTATSTIAGLLPIMVGQEPGSEVMNRIAAPVIGGLLSTVLLTLFLLPVLYSFLISSKWANR